MRNISLPTLVHPGSPYVATIPERMVWTSSSIKLFRRCKRKFFWKYIMRLIPKIKDKHLIIGSGFHDVIGRWYFSKHSSMRKIAAKAAAIMMAEAERNEPHYDQSDYDRLTSMIRTFTGMMVGYAEIYSEDRERWVIDRDCIEKKFIVDMGEFDFAGKVDLLMREDRRIKTRVFVEHKTASRITESYVGRLPLDTQIRGYVFGAQEAFGLPVDTVLYDVIKKSKLRKRGGETQKQFDDRVADAYISNPSANYYREPIQFKPEYIEALKYEIHQVHREFMQIVAPAKNKTGEELMKIIFGQLAGDPHDPRSWGPNDGACHDYFRLCEYHELCIGGLNRLVARMFVQKNCLHEELEDGEE